MSVEKWEAIQRRSISLTGRYVEDLSPGEASTLVQTLTDDEKALVLEQMLYVEQLNQALAIEIDKIKKWIRQQKEKP